jgi:heme oxygenase
MKTNKEYRFKDNPKEKEFHDKFKEMFESNGMTDKTLSSIVFGWKDDRQNFPKQFLTEYEEDICLNIIQWLGSPVGQGFLNNCGFSETVV